MYYSIIVLPIAAASAKKVVVKMGVDETVVLHRQFRVISSASSKMQFIPIGKIIHFL
jgi:hypothetical protein